MPWQRHRNLVHHRSNANCTFDNTGMCQSQKVMPKRRTKDIANMGIELVEIKGIDLFNGEM
jgi:hypothetical protein